MYDDNERTPRHYRKHVAITPHDTNPITDPPRALMVTVAGGGALTMRAVDASADLVFAGLVANRIIEIKTRFVRSTGTSVTVVGLY